MTLVHHELCFGCGRTNLFGLLVDVERQADGGVAGRWFVKQDHQGPARGRAHPGVVASALLESALLAGGGDRAPLRLEVELTPGAGVPVGAFCDVEARVTASTGAKVEVAATASVDGAIVGRLSTTLYEA